MSMVTVEYNCNCEMYFHMETSYDYEELVMLSAMRFLNAHESCGFTSGADSGIEIVVEDQPGTEINIEDMPHICDHVAVEAVPAEDPQTD